jgi:DNA primase
MRGFVDYRELLKEKYLGRILAYLKDECGVEFKKVGPHYWTRCPFHGPDYHPSFNIWIENSYIRSFCLSYCGMRKGNHSIIHVIEEKTDMNLYEAANDLGRYLGIKDTITISKKKHRSKAKCSTTAAAVEEDLIPMREQSPAVLSALRSAAEQYHSYLMSGQEGSSVAREYLTSRGVEEETIVKHQIGFCPGYDSGHEGRLLVTSSEIDGHDLLDAGLISLLNDTERPYLRKYIRYPKRTWKDSYSDFFARRITFPVHDAEGNVRMIQGRIIDDVPDSKSPEFGQVKYLNMPNAPKELLLYGLYQNSQYIAEHKMVVLTEGIFDYLALYKNFRDDLINFRSSPLVVSTLTNDLSDEQQFLLENLSVERYIVAYDGDTGGREGLQHVKKRVKGEVLGVPFSNKVDASKVYSNVRDALLISDIEYLSRNGTGLVILKPGEPLFEAAPPDFFYDAEELLGMLTYRKDGYKSIPEKIDHIKKYLTTRQKQGVTYQTIAFNGCISLPRKSVARIRYTDYEGNALILYLWVIVRQQQTKGYVKATDAELAETLGRSVRSIADYRKELHDKGLLNYKDDDLDRRKLKYSANYFPPAKMFKVYRDKFKKT